MGMKISKKDVFRRIYAKCIDCIHDPLAGGTTKANVKGCTATDCDLWAIRLGVYGEFDLESVTCSSADDSGDEGGG